MQNKFYWSVSYVITCDIRWYCCDLTGHSAAAGQIARLIAYFPGYCLKKWKCQSEGKILLSFAYWVCRILPSTLGLLPPTWKWVECPDGSVIFKWLKSTIFIYVAMYMQWSLNKKKSTCNLPFCFACYTDRLSIWSRPGLDENFRMCTFCFFIHKHVKLYN